jgi:hypothetical protein
MEIAEFDQQVTIFREKFSKAISPIRSEERSGGPFGNQIHQFIFADVSIALILDRNDMLIDIKALTTPTVIYSFHYLLSMLFPERSDVLTVSEAESSAIARWVTAAATSPFDKCIRVAYERFENCMNMRQVGL